MPAPDRLARPPTEHSDAVGAARPIRMPRRTQEMRSREARSTLMRATVDTLIERGYGGLSIKEVAARAGLSKGALAHHYPSKADLVVAATAACYDEALARGQRLASSPSALKDPIGSFVADATSVYFDWPFLAALEVLMVARTDEELMRKIEPVMQTYRVQVNEAWLDAFRRAGLSPADAEKALNLTLNLVRGMGVNRLWQTDQRQNRRLLQAWARLARDQFGLITEA